MKYVASFLLLCVHAPVSQESQEVESLIRQLSSDDIEERDKASARLQKIGEPARSRLIAAAMGASPDLGVRIRMILRGMEVDEENRAREEWRKAASSGLKKGLSIRDVATFVRRVRKNDAAWNPRRWADEDGIHEIWALDGTWQLYLTYESLRRAAVKSYTIIGFPDLRKHLEPDLYPYVRLVHASPSVDGGEFSPVALIRAVNGLLPLGNEGALRACRTYYELYRRSIRIIDGRAPPEANAVREEHRWRMRYDLDDRRIFFVLRLLFERDNGGTLLPRLNLGHSGVPLAKLHEAFPLYPVAVIDDIPFLLVREPKHERNRDNPLTLVEYLEKHGRLRRKPLKPRTGLIEAAETLIDSPAWQLFYRGSTDRSMVLSQALVALRSVFPFGSHVCGSKTYHIIHVEERIRKDFKAIRLLRPRWDTTRQDFVRGN